MTLQRRTDRLEFVILHGDQPVGTIGLSNIDLAKRTAEYGILVGEDSARGKGVAKAASQLIIDFAFRALGMTRLDLTMFADNEPARRLYEGLGFARVRALEPRDKDGRQRPVDLMSLEKPA